MKILLSPDSFKGSLTATEAAKAMAAGIHDYNPSLQTILVPVADGGEGTMNSLVEATGGRFVPVFVQDPLGRQIKADYGVLGDGETCVIEIAEASGLERLTEEERNPLLASSFGTGELIHQALNAGFRKFIIGLGGSATNDGGVGMLQALGMKFFNKEGEEISQGGAAIEELHGIDLTGFDERVASSSFLVASDVKNPFIGPFGASAVFGPQKGATKAMVEQLDQNLQLLANVIKETTGISVHSREGAGAAGGAGGAFLAFFNSKMRTGIEVVLDAVEFDQHLQQASLVLTGEGKTDVQTLSGKAPFGVAQAAKRAQKPTMLISGVVDARDYDVLAPYFISLDSLLEEQMLVEDAMKNASYLLRKKTYNVVARYMNNLKGGS